MKQRRNCFLSAVALVCVLLATPVAFAFGVGLSALTLPCVFFLLCCSCKGSYMWFLCAFWNLPATLWSANFEEQCCAEPPYIGDLDLFGVQLRGKCCSGRPAEEEEMKQKDKDMTSFSMDDPEFESGTFRSVNFDRDPPVVTPVHATPAS